MPAAASQTALLDPILALVTEAAAPATARRLTSFTRQYLHRVPEDELASRPAAAWAGLLRHHYAMLEQRAASRTEVRIFNPSQAVEGWDSSHTVVEIVTDDRPFLVDSTTLAITRFDLAIHLIIHPVLRVERDAGGYLMDLAPIQRELPGSRAESVMHFEIDRVTEPRLLGKLRAAIESALLDVEAAVRDWKAIVDRLAVTIDELNGAVTPYSPEAVAETLAFLRWLQDDHFTFIGYREYRIEDRGGDAVLAAISASSLGILARQAEQELAPRVLARRDALAIARSGPVIITKTNARSTVHRGSYLDYIGVMVFDGEGRLVGERRFLGLFTSSAYNRRPWEIPFVRRKVEEVIQASGLTLATHGGKALLHIMESLPRDELFQATARELYQVAIGIFDLQERQKTRLFVRRDRFGRFFSCLVFIPRDRFNTELRLRIQGILKRSLGGDALDFAVQVSDARLARVHVVVHVKPGTEPRYDVDEIEARLIDAVRSWKDRLGEILVDKLGEDLGLRLARRFGDAFPAAYVEDVTPWVASFDVERLAALAGPDDLKLSLYRPRSRDAGIFRFKLFRFDQPIPLSDVLPILENMGLRIVSERPYRLQLADQATAWIQDFDMHLVRGGDIDLDWVRDRFEDAFRAIVTGLAENDGFNRLIIAAGLDRRQVAVIRAYCRYLLQTGVPFSQGYMEQTLAGHAGIGRALIELFEAYFDPRRGNEPAASREARARHLNRAIGEASDDTLDRRAADLLAALKEAQGDTREAQIAAVTEFLKHQVDRVRSLDDDRILRGFVDAIQATLRTNFFQRRDGAYLCFKVDAGRLPELPKPRPWREIFVASPRMEGIHLRGGPVARGGLRWSDRREDYRTEVLGLLKAQMVKNTLIVPVGAKGGFVVKRLPAAGTRDEVLAEVVSCYRTFIHALLAITDNFLDDRLVPPQAVVRRDEDDPYLVVAADKGTATFSDIANSVSEAHGFWLGDAFASGGSAGYDHKRMGITARGAWESVRRHFLELRIDCQEQDFTVLGIGDMSGDVFGNGMLLSRHIRLLAAFNHQHIFLDPDPDAETSFRERERLFRLERSTWTDYDPTLISPGGGVFPRSAKEIRLSPEVRAWLAIEARALTPQALIHELLKAPVDLLWNGGIGTYVKASTETHAEVGDRTNDAVRVDGRELRARVVGEGGNLGLTQRGRVEFALAGGRINTDALDNSAGVDCSDHEVNIKILLNPAVRDGTLGLEERNTLLAAMTDEVAALVLRNNYLQAQAVSLMERHAIARLGSMAHLIDVLEAHGALDRELEFLPSRDEVVERGKRGLGMSRPELCVLLAYAKMTVYSELLASDVPEDPFLSQELRRYFPRPLQERFAVHMGSHPLRREIIATMITNSMINRMGATFAMRMHEDTGATTPEVAKAYAAAREIFRVRRWWDQIEAQDGRVPSDEQIDVQLAIWDLLRHQTRWLLHRHRDGLDIAALVQAYRDGVSALAEDVEAWGDERWVEQVTAGRLRLEEAGFEAAAARALALIRVLTPALDVIDVAREAGVPVTDVATLHVAVEQALKIGWIMEQVEALPVVGQWHARARGGLRDELFRLHRDLSAKVLADGGPSGAEPAGALAHWMADRRAALAPYEAMVADMRGTGAMDYATVSVAVRSLQQLLAMV